MTILNFMVTIYAGLIVSGLRTLETIPEIYKEPVKKYISGM